MWFEATFIEDFRREVADRRGEPPGLREEPAAFGRHRFGIAEDVLECRNRDSRWVRALKRLLQLLRISEKDDALRGLRHGKNVGERHLTGFIHEQDVDRFFEFFPRP